MTGELRQRQPRIRNRAYLDWLSRAPCVACMARGRGVHTGVQLCHLRVGSLAHGKRPTGAGEKPSDRWCAPMCEPEHRRQHSMAELAFWAEVGVDPFALCIDLEAAYSAGQAPFGTVARHAGAAQRKRREGRRDDLID